MAIELRLSKSAIAGEMLECSADGKRNASAPTGPFASDAERELVLQVRKWTESTAALPSQRKGTEFAQLVPDVVFEIVSPSDDISAIHARVDAYNANGVPVAVLIDPSTYTVTLVRERDSRTLRTDLVEIGEQMPGFVLDAAAIFRIATMRG